MVGGQDATDGLTRGFGREEAMATCVPINALISVDLPTFGRPTTATNPDLYTVWSCVC